MTLACILAFDPPRPESQVTVPLRGLIDVGGAAAILRMIGRLRQVPDLDIRVFTHQSESLCPVVGEVPVFQMSPENIQAGDLEVLLGEGDPEEQVLILQGDLPLLTSDEVHQFLQVSREFAGLSLQVIPADLIPEGLGKRTFKLKEGTFGIGRVLAARRKHVFQQTLWSSVDMLLQDPLKLVGALGMVNLLKLAAGGLSLADVAAVIAEQVKIPVRIFPVQTPGFALNLSKPADIAYAQRMISG